MTMITFFIRTYGCQANVADSQGIAIHLMQLGCLEVGSEFAADIIIINTCAIREKAEQKLWSYIGTLQPLKKQKPYLRVGLIGCVASYKKTEIYTRFDHVSFVFGAREDRAVLYAYLADMIVQLETAKQLYARNSVHSSLASGQDRDVQKLVTLKKLLDKPRIIYGSFVQPKNSKELNRSFINIMTGCNKYCSYCIVPFTRGRETSYPMDQIIEQVARDVVGGALEITLIGQNVNSYIDPQSGAKFPELLRRVAEIPGNFWVRFMSPHPQDMTEDLFDVMAAHRPKLTAALHFPVQSGSNRILKLMNRNYSIEEYLEKINWIRQRMPDATISTDIIVGFPGETSEDFEQTMKVLEAVRYDLVYSFIYSPRAFTKASSMPDDCPAKEKGARLERLQKHQEIIALERNLINVGKTLTCLVEKRLENGKLLARTEGNIRVEFDGPDDYINKFKELYIESTGPAHMSAILICDKNKNALHGGIAKW